MYILIRIFLISRKIEHRINEFIAARSKTDTMQSFSYSRSEACLF